MQSSLWVRMMPELPNAAASLAACEEGSTSVIMPRRAPGWHLGLASRPDLRGRGWGRGVRCRGRRRTSCWWGRRAEGGRCRTWVSCRWWWSLGGRGRLGIDPRIGLVLRALKLECINDGPWRSCPGDSRSAFRSQH